MEFGIAEISASFLSWLVQSGHPCVRPGRWSWSEVSQTCVAIRKALLGVLLPRRAATVQDIPVILQQASGYAVVGGCPDAHGRDSAGSGSPLCLFSFRLYCSHVETKITPILTSSLPIMLFVLLKRSGFKPGRRDSKLRAEAR